MEDRDECDQLFETLLARLRELRQAEAFPDPLLAELIVRVSDLRRIFPECLQLNDEWTDGLEFEAPSVDPATGQLVMLIDGHRIVVADPEPGTTFTDVESTGKAGFFTPGLSVPSQRAAPTETRLELLLEAYYEAAYRIWHRVEKDLLGRNKPADIGVTAVRNQLVVHTDGGPAFTVGLNSEQGPSLRPVRRIGIDEAHVNPKKFPRDSGLVPNTLELLRECLAGLASG